MHPEHTILVAFTVYAPDWTAAQSTLMRQLPKPGANDIDSWWIAEDERDDGSDNDSAVFVPKGDQHKWYRQVEDSIGSVACPTCKGRGGDDPATTAYPAPCSHCWGRGWVLPNDDEA